MQVAFHAPLKAPDHPVPSGDRTMARALVKALGRAGHVVRQPSAFRSFLAAPSRALQGDRRASAETEIARIAALWDRQGAPDAWFTYHNYYKAPDLLGPRLARLFDLPYIVAEASYAPRRADAWVDWSAAADESSRCAHLHLCFTARDRDGVARIADPGAKLVDLPPFVDLDDVPLSSARATGQVPRLLTVAMMRPGDKLASYRLLGDALARLGDRPWTLMIVGDGPARDEVERAFAGLPADCLLWRGEMGRPAVLRAMAEADLFVWPGFGEAFGLAYLEAQAAGLPVVALDVAGVASTVIDGRTGVLVSDASPGAYAEAIARMLSDPARRVAMGTAAARFVRSERSLDTAARTLDIHLRRLHAGVTAHA